MSVTKVEALAHIEQGYRLLNEGDAEKALDRFMPVAEAMPTVAAAWHGLGNACSALGRDGESLDFLSRACSLSPQTGLYWGDYGKRLLESGRCAEAAEAFSRSIAHLPEDLGVRLTYGQTLSLLGRDVEAIDEAGFVLRRRPDSTAAMGLLGNIMRKLGRLDEAVNLYRDALRVDVANHEIWHNLAAVFAIQHRWRDAVSCAAEAIHLSPNFWQAYVCLGLALTRQKLYDEAETCLQKAHQLSEGHADACLELGNLAMARMDGVSALQWYCTAIERSPHNVAAILNAAGLLRLNGGIGQALDLSRLALQIAPNSTAAMNLEVTCLSEIGRMRDAVEGYRKILEQNPTDATAQTNLLYNLNFHTAFEPEVVARIHRAWGCIAETEARAWNIRRPENASSKTRIRVGYVSGDFRRHSVMYFMHCLLEGHHRDDFEIYCYSTVDREDEVTASARRLDLVWRDIASISAQEAAELIAGDEIDILVDLAGHTGTGRLPVFAAKPAPLQCAYLGYPNTTGLSTIDYRLVDSITDPPGHNEAFYTEQLVRIDPVFLCFKAPDTDVSIHAEPPCRRDGIIRFGTFNNSKKIDVRTAQAWGALLTAIPEARLILKARAYGSAEAREHVAGLLQAEGISSDRVEFRASELEFSAHLAQYNDVDVALDCFPYNGTTTTMEALWMGVPVITMSGDLHVSRVGQSILTALGRPEWVARDVTGFVAVGRTLAEDPDALRRLRAGLRDELKASPLMDASSMVARVENFYRQAWDAHCTRERCLENLETIRSDTGYSA